MGKTFGINRYTTSNKNNEIKNLHKDNFSKDEHISGLQTELNNVKDKYYKKEKELNEETERLNVLLQQQEVQYHSVMASEIDKLNQDIPKLQGEKNALLFEIQQKQHEIHNLQNTLTETVSVAEKNHERLIKEKENEANNRHNKIMAEKNIDMQDVIKKYQDLENRFNQLGQNFSQMEQNHIQQMNQYRKSSKKLYF